METGEGRSADFADFADGEASRRAGLEVPDWNFKCCHSSEVRGKAKGAAEPLWRVTAPTEQRPPDTIAGRTPEPRCGVAGMVCGFCGMGKKVLSWKRVVSLKFSENRNRGMKVCNS